MTRAWLSLAFLHWTCPLKQNGCLHFFIVRSCIVSYNKYNIDIIINNYIRVTISCIDVWLTIDTIGVNKCGINKVCKIRTGIIEWFIDCLLIGRLIDCLIGCVFHWLIIWLICLFIDWLLVDWAIDWSIGWLPAWLIGWLIYKLVDWLLGWVVFYWLIAACLLIGRLID